MGEAMLGVSAAARLLICNESTVRKLADTGSLPFRRTTGGQRLFELADVERLAAERRLARQHGRPANGEPQGEAA